MSAVIISLDPGGWVMVGITCVHASEDFAFLAEIVLLPVYFAAVVAFPVRVARSMLHGYSVACLSRVFLFFRR